MSSPSLSAVFRATVFQLTLLSCAAFVVISLIILWGVTGYYITSLRDQVEDRITEESAFIKETYERDGVLAAEQVFEINGRLIWREGDIYERLEEREIVAVLRADDDVVLAGYPGLWANVGWGDAELDHDEIDDPITTLQIELDTDLFLTVGLFYPPEIWELENFRRAAAVALFVIVLPLSLITGYFLSRSVYRRLDTLSLTAETVASGSLHTRAPIRGNGDEFDRLSEGINRMLDRLEAANRNIEAVSVGVAHDLKTPLANIGGRLELIGRDLGDNAAIEAHVAAADAHLKTLLGTFDALLRLGEVEAGQRKAAFREVDLSEVATDLGASFEPVFEEATKSLDQAIHSGIMVLGDRDLLAQLMSNLLENALEHARDGARVWIRLGMAGGRATLEIGDDGPGIPAHLKARVFERFYRAESSRTTPGSGLGLSLVKAIADLHEASLSLDQDAPGSVFRLIFPAQD